MLQKIREDLKEYHNPIRAKNPLFFKINSGDYAEHDQFLGISVPNLRKVAKEYSNLPLSEIKKLMQSSFNEERLLALIILVSQYQKSSDLDKQKIYDFYLSNTRYINNWNLVDASAHLILGVHLINKNKKILYQLVKSDFLWDRRIAIIATWYFIKNDLFEDTIKISEKLLNDQENLIHKATGWMLREVGKRNEQVLIEFLDRFYNKMPRTMLRYAIEKMSANQKKYYLKKR